MVALAPTLIRAADVNGGLLSLVWLAPLWPVIGLRFGPGLFLSPARSLRFTRDRLLALLFVAITTFGFLVWLVGDADFGNIARVATLLTAVLFPFAVFAPRRSPTGARRLLAAAVASLFLYLAVNFALWILLGQAQASGTAVMLGSLGVPSQRIVFPLGGGVNNFGGVAGAALAAALILILVAHTRLLRVGAIGMAGLALSAVLLTDNRGALLFAFVAAGVVAIGHALRRPRLAIFVGAVTLLIVPITMAGGFALLSGALEDTPQQLTRNEGDLATLNNRAQIWESSVSGLIASPRGLVIGFGFEGNVASGAAAEYGEIVFPEDDPARYTHTAHNGLLQAVLDYGILGTAIVVGLLLRALWLLLSDPRHKLQLACGVGLFAFLLLAATEAHLMPEISDTYPFVMLLTFSALAARRPPKDERYIGRALRGAEGR